MATKRFIIALLLLTGSATAAACSEKQQDDARATATSLGRDAAAGANEVGARSQAEAMRANLKASKEAEQSLRDVALLKAASENLPGNPTIAGITDGDGDGMDDDGMVEITLNQAKACVMVPATGDNTEVTGEACAAP